MVNVTVLVDHRGLDHALRSFAKLRSKAGVGQELTKRQAYTPPSARRRRKAEKARKREAKRARLAHEAGAREPPQGRRLARQIRKARDRGKR